MKETTVVKNGRNFIFEFRKNEVYVGTEDFFSLIAAQMLVHEFMAPLRWKAAGKWISMEKGVLGVGYKIPLFQRTKAKKLIMALAEA